VAQQSGWCVQFR